MRVPEYIESIAPYQAGKPISETAREFGLNACDIVKLASNENPLGMSPKARAAIALALDEVARYPDANGFILKEKLSERWHIDANRIVLGNGSNDVLELVAAAFLSPACSSVFSQYAFVVYALATQARGAEHIVAPASGLGHDLEAMLAAIQPNTRVVFIANPNNPTGTFIAGDVLHRFIAAVPRDVLVVLDEAYSEYLRVDQQYDSRSWLETFENLLVVRTFSKAYGLAGLRIGYGLGSAWVIDKLNRVRQPFNANVIAQFAAVAALDDTDFLEKTRDLNRAGMHQLEQGLLALGLKWQPSAGNFLTVQVGDATHTNIELLRRGVIVRPLQPYGLPDYIRVTVGTADENARFLLAMTEIVS